MNKDYIVKKNYEIQKIIKNNKKLSSKYFVVYYINNKGIHDRYCISISKKIGNAVIRNTYKRKIKDILMKNNFNKNCDYVIIVKKSILNESYDNIKNDLVKILNGEEDEKK